MKNLNRIAHYTNKYTNSNAVDIILRLSKNDVGQQTELPYVVARDVILENDENWKHSLDMIGHFSSVKDIRAYHESVTTDEPVDLNHIKDGDSILPDTVCARTPQLLLPVGNRSYHNVTPVETAAINLKLKKALSKDAEHKINLIKLFGLDVGGANPQNVSKIASQRIIPHNFVFIKAPHVLSNKNTKYQFIDFKLYIEPEDKKQLKELLDVDYSILPTQFSKNLHDSKLKKSIKRIIVRFFGCYRSLEFDCITLTSFNNDVLSVDSISKDFSEQIYTKLLRPQIEEVNQHQRNIIIAAIKEVTL